MMCAVVTFVYRRTPDVCEQASLRQCLTVFAGYPLYIVCPQSLDISLYQRLCADYQNEVIILRLEDKWFESVASYNELLLTAQFYRRFRGVEYILIYQLDAWVFHDEVEKWCHKGVVYIGAPWFTDRGEMYPFVGNGGFSLRHVSSFTQVLEGTFRPQHVAKDFFWPSLPAKTAFRSVVKKCIHVCEMLFCLFFTRHYCKYNRWDYEDVLFGKLFALLAPERAASTKEAAFFSFERFPSALYDVTRGVLPMGCHAYSKHDPDFWRTWISS